MHCTRIHTPTHTRTHAHAHTHTHTQVHTVQYNLHLLKAMLECNAVEGKVDEATYSHIIRMWVKDVRDRSERASPQSLEVTPLSDSDVSECVGGSVWLQPSSPPYVFFYYA